MICRLFPNDIDIVLTGPAAGNFLRYDGVNWVNVTAVDTGDLADGAVTFEKFQDIAANSVLARTDPGSGSASALALASGQLVGRGDAGDVSAISPGAGLSMTGTTLNAEPAGLALLATATAASSTSVDFTSYIDGTYDEYIVTVSAYVPSTDGTDLFLRTSTDGGASFDSGGSDYAYRTISGPTDNTVVNANNSETAGAISLFAGDTAGNDTGEASHLTLHLHAPSDTNKTLMRWFAEMSASDGKFRFYHGIGVRHAVADVDALRFLSSAGTIASGEFKLYGVKS